MFASESEWIQHIPFTDEDTEAQRGAGTCQDHTADHTAVSKPKASSPPSYVLHPESGAKWLCLHWATLQGMLTPPWEGGTCTDLLQLTCV